LGKALKKRLVFVVVFPNEIEADIKENDAVMN
jgi:hypothetical protein